MRGLDGIIKSMDVKVKVAQSCLTLCNPVDYIVHGMLQIRILEWVAIPLSRGSSQPRAQTQCPQQLRRTLDHFTTREAPTPTSLCLSNSASWCQRILTG